MAGNTLVASQPLSPAPQLALNSITAHPRLAIEPTSTTTVRGRATVRASSCVSATESALAASPSCCPEVAHYLSSSEVECVGDGGSGYA